MIKRIAFLFLPVACAGCLLLQSGEETADAPAEATAEAAPTPEQLGTVNFPTSCNEGAQKHLDRGLALLHHMTYDQAGQAFEEAAQADGECAMPLWGQSMVAIHPLWSDKPTEEQAAAAKAALEKAKGLEADEREKAYLTTTAAYYNAQGGLAPRLKAFRLAWKNVHDAHPDDLEAASFYALAHMATAPRGDQTLRKQREAGAIAEGVLAKVPDHPGAHHYIIHAYDHPPLAAKALDVSRSYGKVAPNVPHALHMPTHIFTRLGLWEDSIAWNMRSRDAAEQQPATGPLSLHYLHAVNYMSYAYLQGAQDKKHAELWAAFEAIERPLQTHPAAAYALAATPAGHALERRDWKEAGELPVRTPEAYPWDAAPEFESITHFARALGHAHSGDLAAAKQDIAALKKLRPKVDPKSPFVPQLKIQKLSAEAALAYAQKKKAKALKLQKQAAALEAKTGKHPMQPGEVQPATELLADMLLDMGRHQAALNNYEKVLERWPNRFNSVYGAGMASEKVKKPAKAREHYLKLVEICKNADAEREGLTHAKSFLSKTTASR